MNDKKTVFLTGATGLIGSYLLKILLREGYKVYVLARSEKDKTANQRVWNILKFWDNEILKYNGKLIVLEGDITKDGLGLDKKILGLLEKEINEIFHCAALTDINRPIEEIRKVNVEGTRKVLELAKMCSLRGNLRKANHLSTAYVCGDYQEEFSENNLNVGQKFNTTYEQSKFEAEMAVIDYRNKGIWIDIFRPAMVVGEAQTGKTFQFKHVYQFLFLCNLGIFDSLPLLDSYLNLVPVDSVAEGVFGLSVQSNIKNNNYHLFPEKAVLVEDLISVSRPILKCVLPKLISLKEFVNIDLTPTQRTILKNSIFALNAKTKLDSTYTNSILKNYNYNMLNFSNNELFKIVDYFFNKKS